MVSFHKSGPKLILMCSESLDRWKLYAKTYTTLTQAMQGLETLVISSTTIRTLVFIYPDPPTSCKMGFHNWKSESDILYLYELRL